ncbi:MAG: GSCFA domain-containing protein, partial [Crocinitomicaceae bacterium]
LTELQIVWRTTIRLLKDKFPRLKLVFSLSPVRHLKDGVIENQRSKARLIELIHSLDGYYFPAYELVMDDLRDYRFYARDKVHPSSEAIDYIFESFSQSCIDKNSTVLFSEINQLRKEEQHRSLSGESDTFEKFIQKHQLKKSEFLARYPNLNW